MMGNRVKILTSEEQAGGRMRFKTAKAVNSRCSGP
jgi:hypothetical protein